MSRAFTVGPRTHNKTADSAARVNAAKKPPVSRTGVGDVGNGATAARNSSFSRYRRSSHQTSGTTAENSNSSPKVKSSPSVNQTKSSVARTSTTPPKPRVVSLADLNSGGRKKSDTNIRRTASTKRPTLAKKIKTSGTKTGKKTNMWDSNPTPTNTSSTSQLRGSRNVIAGNHGNGGQDHGNQGSSNSVSSPGSKLTSAGDGQAAESGRQAAYQPQVGYTRVAPDPKKRDKLQSQRSEELARLDAYKEKNKLGRVSMKPSRVGGSQKSEEEARRKQQREQEDRKYELIRKRQQWAAEKRNREEAEFAEKKSKAREQTERNKQRDQDRQRELQADRRDWIARGGLARLQGGSEGGAPDTTYEEEEDLEFDESAIDGLAEMFPHKNRKKLIEMLTAADGDVNKVIDWLSG